MINRSFYIKFKVVPPRMIEAVQKDKPYLVLDETVEGLWIFANDNNKFFHTRMEECLFAGLEGELPEVTKDTKVALPEPDQEIPKASLESLDSELEDLKELESATHESQKFRKGKK